MVSSYKLPIKFLTNMPRFKETSILEATSFVKKCGGGGSPELGVLVAREA